MASPFAMVAAIAFIATIPGTPASAASDPVPTPRISPHKASAADATGAVPAVGGEAGSGDGEFADGPVAVGEPMDGEAGGDFVDGEVRLPPADIPGGDPNNPMALTGANPGDALDPNVGADGSPFNLAPAAKGDLAPVPASNETTPTGALSVAAKLTADSPPIGSGVTWRVFSSEPGSDGKLGVVGVMTGGAVNLQLKPGTYFVHAAYGRAGITKKVIVTEKGSGEILVFNAGGLRLSALVGKDQPLDPTLVSFDIYAPDGDGSDERLLLVPKAPPSRIIGLNAGTYHVVCRYGDANAVVRADIRVEPGKLTEATVYQNAARMTLKLVSEHGGEALANTAWSVITPSGETVSDSVGAFPSVVLAAGDYTAIAKHDGRIFERNFTVEPGRDRDVEVIAGR